MTAIRRRRGQEVPGAFGHVFGNRPDGTKIVAIFPEDVPDERLKEQWVRSDTSIPEDEWP